jgi:polysaccharide biosynthesis protein PslH
MKILFITPRLPYPPFQGDRLKIYHLLRILSRRHQIVLLSMIESERELEFVPELEPFCQEIHPILHPKSLIYRNLIGNIFDPQPFQVAYFRSPAFQSQLEKLLTQQTFDLIHTHLIRLLPYTIDLKIPRLLDLTDAISNYLGSRYQATNNPILKVGLYLEWQRMLNFERHIDRFEAVSVCAEPDRLALLDRAPNAQVEIVRNGLDLDYFQPHPSIVPEPNTLIFTGNMAYAPNQDGILYFCEQILPLIAAKIPTIKLYIVGKSPSNQVLELATDDRIVVTKLVPDLRDYYARAQVAICPIRFGAGTLNKIIEPMAMGIPVVANPLVCGGMNAIDGENILFGDTPPAFAARTIELLTDPALNRKIAAGGLKLVHSEHDWEQIVSNLEVIYHNIQ